MSISDSDSTVSRTTQEIKWLDVPKCMKSPQAAATCWQKLDSSLSFPKLLIHFLSFSYVFFFYHSASLSAIVQINASLPPSLSPHNSPEWRLSLRPRQHPSDHGTSAHVTDLPLHHGDPGQVETNPQCPVLRQSGLLIYEIWYCAEYKTTFSRTWESFIGLKERRLGAELYYVRAFNFVWAQDQLKIVGCAYLFLFYIK